jgi:hypothetical protein
MRSEVWNKKGEKGLSSVVHCGWAWHGMVCGYTEESIVKVEVVLGMNSLPTSSQVSCMSQFFKEEMCELFGKILIQQYRLKHLKEMQCHKLFPEVLLKFL